MNNLSLAIYLSDIVDKVFQTMTFLSITGGILYAIFVLFLVMEPDRDLLEVIHSQLNALKKE